MNKLFGLKAIANITLWIVLIGGLVFTLGIGISVMIARHVVTSEANKIVQQEMRIVESQFDGEMQRIEDAAYSLASRYFGNTIRHDDGTASVQLDPKTFNYPTRDELYTIIEQFMEANPIVCGIAVGFEHYVYPEYSGKYGFAPYVTRLDGKFQRINVGEEHNFQNWEWYKDAVKLNAGHWANPFRESFGHIITCFSIPLHGYNNRLVGVLSVDVNIEAFPEQSKEVAPFPNSKIMVTDVNQRLICHPDSTCIAKPLTQYGKAVLDSLKNNDEGQITIDNEQHGASQLYFVTMPRTRWKIIVEAPEKEIYGTVNSIKSDITMLSLASIIIMVLCFMYLLHRLQSVAFSKAAIDSELKVASGIQLGMLPKNYPAFPNRTDLDIYGILKPAKSVGGDLYDYFIHNDKLFFCIGDVSGKGVPASLFMAVVRTLFRNVSHHEIESARIITELNAALSAKNDQCIFCTMFLGVLDLKTGILDYCNAGHNAPIFRTKNGETIDVQYATIKSNIALGIIPHFDFESETLKMHPGEAIFLYTDGVTEAENIEKQLFGEKAVLKALAEARNSNHLSAKDFIEHVNESISIFTTGAEQSDDITMLVVEYAGAQKNDSEFRLVLNNDVTEIPQLADWLQEVGTEIGINKSKIFQMQLALEEAVSNVMRYAYPGEMKRKITILATDKGEDVMFEIDDEGIPFDPTLTKNPDTTLSAEERPIGGLGILLVRQIMRQVEYQRVEGHNHLTLIATKK